MMLYSASSKFCICTVSYKVFFQKHFFDVKGNQNAATNKSVDYCQDLKFPRNFETFIQR